MRLAFMFMAGINLIFFIWQYSTDSGAGVGFVQPPKKDARNLQIVLLHERKTAGAGREQQLAKVVPAPKPAAPTQPQNIKEKIRESRCFEVGPISGPNLLDNMVNKLSLYDAVTQSRTTQKKERLRYWVMYVAENKSTAQRVYKDMRKKGLKDLFMMTEADRENTISLGLFRGENTADRRVAMVKRMGYNPVVKKQYNIKTLYWLDVKEASGRPLSDPDWVEILDESPGALHKPVSCK